MKLGLLRDEAHPFQLLGSMTAIGLGSKVFSGRRGSELTWWSDCRRLDWGLQ